VLSFLSTDDTAIYADVDLNNGYDETRPLFIRYVYTMEAASTDGIVINWGHYFKPETFARTQAYVVIPDNFSPDNDTDFHTRTIELPVQTLGDFPRLSLRLSRLGTDVLDVNENNFSLLSVTIYQVAI